MCICLPCICPFACLTSKKYLLHTEKRNVSERDPTCTSAFDVYGAHSDSYRLSALISILQASNTTKCVDPPTPGKGRLNLHSTFFGLHIHVTGCVGKKRKGNSSKPEVYQNLFYLKCSTVYFQYVVGFCW